MGKRGIRHLATPKPLNRSSPKVAYVITIWMSTNVQNLVTIPQGVSFPRLREITHKRCLLGFFFPGSSNGLQSRPLNRFSRVIVKQCGSAQECAFSRLENKNLTFAPRNSRITAIIGQILTEKPLCNRVLPRKLRLIVVVAP